MTATLIIDKHFAKSQQKLDRSISAKVLDFIGKIQNNPDQPGLNLKTPKGALDKRVMTARVDDFYRAVLFNMGQRKTFLLVAVRPHDDAYSYAGRLRLDVNPVHGALEIYEETFGEGTLLETAPPAPPAEPDVAAGESGGPTGELDVSAGEDVPAGEADVPDAAGPGRAGEGQPVLSGISASDLDRLGIAEQFVGRVLAMTDQLELERFCDQIPMVQGLVLLDLQAGRGVDEILAELLAESDVESGDIDRGDVAAAAARPLSQLQFAGGDNEELIAALSGDMSAWRVWLHPTQRRLAYHDGWNGPFRVTGGAGTGKTVTALHRARHLAERVQQRGAGERILLATFTKNLSAALEDQLEELAGAAVLGTVDVVNIDSLASRVLSRPSEGRRPRLVGDDSDDVKQAWDVAAAGQGDWSTEFLAVEWLHVVLAQGINDRRAYFRARRVGRGVPLNRAKRAQVWELIERFQQHLRAAGLMTFTQANALAAEQVAAAGSWYRYAVVDEAQDLHPAHWRLLRAITKEGPDDLFLVGDAHQRIYGRPLILSHYGIKTRGRSRRLTVNYRTSAEIMAWCVAVMRGVAVDDLEGDADTLAGARSEFHGEPPEMIHCAGSVDELDRMVEQVKRWLTEVPDLQPGDIGVLSATGGNVKRAAQAIRDAGLASVIVQRTEDANRDPDAVQVMTMHRAKGLEFRCVAITRVGADAFPGQLPSRTSEEERELNAARQRSLLYVAASRARERLALFYSGQPSALLPGVG